MGEKEKIILKAKLLVTDVYRKSTTPALKGVKRGDELCLSTVFTGVGRSTRGTHAVWVEVKNSRTEKVSYISYNSAPMIFDAIGYDVL